MIQTLRLWRTRKGIAKEQEQKKEEEENKERVVKRDDVKDVGLKVKREAVKQSEIQEETERLGQR